MDSLMVTNKEEELIGLITLKRIQLEDRNRSIEEIMERNVLTVAKNDSLVTVLEVMNRKKVGYMPVVDTSGKLAGLITRSSILAALSNQLIDMEVEF